MALGSAQWRPSRTAARGVVLHVHTDGLSELIADNFDWVIRLSQGWQRVHRHGDRDCFIKEDLMPANENFGNCLAQHIPYLNRMVRSLTRGDPMTDDIVQQTMLKALVHADQFRFQSTIKTWLTSIAMNEVRQVYRCKWRMHSVPLVTENLEGGDSPRVESPSQGYQATEREALVRQAVSRLPESYRSVVELCDLQLLPLQEAAARLRLTLAAVKTRRQRARRKLRPFVVEFKP
jgi:RNA polymerase sigma-70 factor (ECF subfamily)